MAYDKVVDSAALDATFKGIADAIREKNRTTGNITDSAMAAAINDIHTTYEVEPEVTAYENLLQTAIANLQGKAYPPPVDPTDDPDLIPENIREGIDIWGVIGTMSEGVSGIDYGEITLTDNTTSITVQHNLKTVPSWAEIIMKEPGTVGIFANINGMEFRYSGTSYSYISGAEAIKSSTDVVFNNAKPSTSMVSEKFRPVTYCWMVKA